MIFSEPNKQVKGVVFTSNRIFDKVSKKASEKGVSINSLENKAGVSSGSIYKWNTVSPTIRNLSKVAEALECSIDELLDDTD